jgi:hypothetical protein
MTGYETELYTDNDANWIVAVRKGDGYVYAHLFPHSCDEYYEMIRGMLYPEEWESWDGNQVDDFMHDLERGFLQLLE